jgi:hypothetical protein
MCQELTRSPDRQTDRPFREGRAVAISYLGTPFRVP